MDKITKYVINKPKRVILISLLILIPCIVSYFFTSINYDILTYLPQRLDSVKGEKILSENYNYGSMTMVIVEDMPSKRIVELKNKISDVDDVEAVVWADDIIDTSVPSNILPDELKDVFYSSDGKYTMMLVQFSADASSKDTMKAVSNIKKVTQSQCMLSGLTPISADTQELSEKQTPIYTAIAVVLALIAMLISMESFAMPFILMIVLAMAVIYNMGTNLILGQVSYITQCIAAILQLGVTMDYSIFLVNRFNEEKQTCNDSKLAMEKALRSSLTSLTGSSLTTIFGFLALCFMQLTLGFNIGIVMAKGVVLGVLSVIVILPAFILVFEKSINKRKHKQFKPDFHRTIGFVIKHNKVFASLFIVLLIPAIILSANVKKYYNLSSTLPANLDSVKALETLKSEFNMTTSHFIIVDDSLSAKKLTEMEDKIQKVEGINNLFAYNRYIGSSIPFSIIPDEINDIVRQGGYQLMLVNSEYDSATEESNEQVKEINSIIKQYDSKGYITGEGALYNDLIGITRTDFTVTNIISIIAIFILIMIVFKSISIPAILIGSIELAILINEGISALMGTEIPFVAPTIISCVQLGATVDYAILLTSRFKEELESGCDKLTAIKKAANESMQSVFQSAVVFFLATFGVYLVSSISIVKEICAMLSRGAIISALIIMFIMTPILYISEGLISRTSKNWGIVKAIPKVQNANSSAIETDTVSEYFNNDADYTEFVITDDELEDEKNEQI